jgi:hypothetical protein
VATELSRESLRRLARLGAAQRLEELRREEAEIRAAFPDLEDERGGTRRRRGRPHGRPSAGNSASNEKGAATGAAKRQARYKMSAAQKRAVSERMKKYWAARRKANG